MAEQWEYMYVEAVFDAAQKNWQASWPEGESRDGTVNEVLNSLLTRLGGIGWEIVSVTPSYGGTAYSSPKDRFTIDSYHTLFKRR